MDVVKGVIEEAMWWAMTFRQATDEIMPKLLAFWAGAASAVVFFLPEILASK